MKTRDLEIRERLAAYVVGELTLPEFDAWFTSVTWDSPVVSDVAGEVELAVDEYTSEHWTEEELRHRFEPLVQRYTVSVPEPSTTTGSSGAVMHLRRALGEALRPFSVVDTRAVEVSG